MCVTEKWFYRECGCHYNHHILCSTYRRTRGPSVDPAIQDSGHRWNEEAGVDANAASKQLRRHARPTEPQDCPQHATMERFFQNQVCEDCLLARLPPKPPELEHPAASARPVPTPDDGEGLIWDSEVKVEIQNENSEPVLRPKTPDVAFLDSRPHENIGSGESHIEAKVGVELYSVSAEEPSSPLSLTFDDEASSRSSSMPISPPSPAVTGDYGLVSPLYQNRRYGLAFHRPFFADLNDADDEFDSCHEQYYGFPLPPSRGRSRVRGDVNGSERSAASLEISRLSATSRPNSKRLSRFEGLRSFSNNPMSNSRFSDEARLTDNHSTSSLAPSPTSTRFESSNSFSGLRLHKTTALIAETIEATTVLGADGCTDTSQIPFAHQMSGRSSPMPPRKSSLKNWAFRKFRDRKSSRRSNGSRPHGRLRSLAPSPTGSWSRNQLGLGEKMYSQMSDSVHEIASNHSTQEDERQGQIIEERPASQTILVASPAYSATLNTERAVQGGYMDFDLGFDEVGEEEGYSGINLDSETACDDYDRSPGLPLHLRLAELKLERVASRDSWPLRSQPNQKENGGPPSSLPAMFPAPEAQRHVEEDAQMETATAEGSHPADSMLTPLLRPGQGRIRAAAKAVFPPRKSSLRMRVDLRKRSRPPSECDIPVPALVPAS